MMDNVHEELNTCEKYVQLHYLHMILAKWNEVMKTKQ